MQIALLLSLISYTPTYIMLQTILNLSLAFIMKVDDHYLVLNKDLYFTD